MAEKPGPETYLELADEFEQSLCRHILDPWFPKALREGVGFFQDFDRDWSPIQPPSPAAVVYHARLTYVASLAAMHFPAQRDRWLSYARHGASSLKQIFWDKQEGGFFWNAGSTGKHVYGIAFAIYALATLRKANPQENTELAESAFVWLNTHARDQRHGGYFEVLDRNGKPTRSPEIPRPVTGPADKSMNTHIHLLEAFTALYEVSPSTRLEARLEELEELLCGKVFNGAGLSLFFREDWTVVDGTDSYGHDVETAFLLHEAAEALCRPRDHSYRVAKRLVDHALDVAWDREFGGLYDEGTTEKALSLEKIWWTQAESLNALLLMHELYGSEDGRYWRYFLAQWEAIRDRQIDAEFGGWLPSVTQDGTPVITQKSGPWTDPYHQSRALIGCIQRLRRLAQDAPNQTE